VGFTVTAGKLRTIQTTRPLLSHSCHAAFRAYSIKGKRTQERGKTLTVSFLELLLQAHLEAIRQRNRAAIAETRQLQRELEAEGHFCASGCKSHEACRNS
jgi:hypothetical protein